MMKKKSKKTKRDTCVYPIEIANWDMQYSLSVNRTKDIVDGPLWEHSSLQMTGNFLHPEKLKDKLVDVTILWSRRLEEVLKHPEKYTQELESIGSLTARGEHRESIISLPFDTMQTICLLLQAEKIKYVVLSGLTLYHGSTLVDSIYFEREYIPEDWM